MPGFSLDDYEPVADRIERFWKDHPSGQIQTDLIHRDEKSFIVKASVWRSGSNMLVLKALTQEAGDDIGRVFSSPDSTGYAEEIIGSTNVNRTSALENCETSAIGRALANLGYAVKNRASREEMAKAQPEPRPRSGMKRSPTAAEAARGVLAEESHTNGSQGHLTPDQALQVTKIKHDLLGRLEGDKTEAARLWEGTLETFGLDPKKPLPADMIGAIEHSIGALIIKGEDG